MVMDQLNPFCQGFGPARTLNQLVNLLLRTPVQMG
jgi:hypothetical protein